MPEHSDNTQIIPWQRYWCLRGAEIASDDDGFLSKGNELDLSPEAKPLAEFDHFGCLVLLGTPGSGKSREMKGALERDEGLTHHVNLGQFTEGEPARRAIFEHPVFQEWKSSSDQTLTLYLDSLDECMLGIIGVTHLLAGTFEEFEDQSHRLRLRLACRSANWAVSLENTLIQVWGRKQVCALELLQLRLQDVDLAVESRGLSATQFRQALTTMNVGPLAAKPITLLKMLIPLFRGQNELPSGPTELYAKGCLRLASEPNAFVADRTSDPVGRAEDIVRTAEHLAAVMVFSGSRTIDTSLQRDEEEDDSLGVSATVPDLGRSLPDIEVPSREAVRQVLRSGLMTLDKDNELLRFEHRSFQEFLCAKYIAQHSLPVDRLLSLFRVPGEVAPRVSPQLIEVAGWLASLDDNFWNAMLTLDPAMLLRSDQFNRSEGDRKALFFKLCESLRNELDTTRDWSPATKLYPRLSYSGIAEDIRAILENENESKEVRDFAIDVVSFANVDDALDLVASIAVNTSADQLERENCARAVAYAQSDSEAAANAKLQLVPLLECTANDDPRDVLRGCALLSVWPDKISTAEFFKHLTSSFAPNYLGPHSIACQRVRDELGPNNLVEALKWSARQPSRRELGYSLKEVMNAIFRAAWKWQDRPGVLEAFAEAAAKRLEFHEELITEESWRKADELPIPPQEAKRMLCVELVPSVKGISSAAFRIIHFLQLLSGDDFGWCVEHYMATADEDAKAIWLELAERTWNGTASQQVLVESFIDDQRLQQAFAHKIALLDPSSPESKQAREDEAKWAAEIEARENSKEQEPPQVPADQLIGELLEKMEAEGPDRWWEVANLLSVEGDSPYWGDVWKSKITELPGWEASDRERQVAITNQAVKYLEACSEQPEEWVGANHLHYPSMAGMKALFLLQDEAPDKLAGLSADTWAKWSNIILDYPNISFSKHTKAAQQLVQRCHELAPEALVGAVKNLLAAEDEGSVRVDLLELLAFDWSDKLADALLESATSGVLNPSCTNHLLTELISHGVEEARTFCHDQIRAYSDQHQKRKLSDDKFVAYAKALFANDIRSDEWQALWTSLESDRELAVKCLGEAIRERGTGDESDIVSSINDEQICDLCIWLHDHFPDTREHAGFGFRSIGPMDHVNSLRDRLPGLLASRESLSAVKHIRRLRDHLKQDWLTRLLILTRKSVRKNQWVPIAPADLLRLLVDNRCRVVRGDAELLRLVVEGLSNVGRRLREEGGLQFIWNNPNDRWEPKDENSLSDWLARELKLEFQGRGVNVLREVDLKRGSTTDVYVITPEIGNAGECKVVIETKGCWNRDVKTDIEKQLRDRYLCENGIRFGVYVVGWYYCDAWDSPDDGRRTNHSAAFRGMSVEEAQASFGEMAEKLEVEDGAITALVLDCTVDDQTRRAHRGPRRGPRAKRSSD